MDLPDEFRGLLAAYADGVARELEISFSYAGHQYPDAAVSRLLVVGGGATIPGLAARLSAAVRTPASAVAPADLASSDGTLKGVCASPVLTCAMGLALFPES